MTLSEKEDWLNQLRHLADDEFNLAYRDYQDEREARYFSQFDTYPTETLCPYCGEPIVDGDDFMYNSSNEMCHSECWDKENGGIL